MAKIENLLMVLHLLMARRVVTLDLIVRECNVSERTAFRYIGSLEAAGFALERENSGYRLLSRSGALSTLSPSELSAVYLGIEMLESVLGVEQLEVFRRVKLKLESFITAEVRNELNTLVQAVAKTDDSRTLREHLIVSLLKVAQLQNLKVRLYHSNSATGIQISSFDRPSLQFEKEWKLATEVDNKRRLIKLADIVDIEFE